MFEAMNSKQFNLFSLYTMHRPFYFCFTCYMVLTFFTYIINMTIYTIHAVSYEIARYISSFHTQREVKFMNPAVTLVILLYYFSLSNW